VPLFIHRWIAASKGKTEGNGGIPPDNMDNREFIASYEWRIKDLAESDIAIVTRKWHRKDEKLKEKYCAALANLTNVSEQLKQSGNALKERQKEADSWRLKLQEFHQPPLSYYLLIIFLAVSEFPMNGIVFDILGEGKLATYIVAAFLMSIPIAAHYLGIWLREESLFKNPAHLVMFVMFGVAICATVLGVAYIREKYFEAAGITRVLGIPMDPRMVTFVFLGFNLLIFMLALVASYQAHLHGTEKTRREYHITRLNFKKARRLFKRAEKEFKRLEAKLHKLHDQVSRLSAKRQKLHLQTQGRIDAIRNTAEGLMTIYRRANVLHRSNKSYRFYELKLEKPTIVLDEECDEKLHRISPGS